MSLKSKINILINIARNCLKLLLANKFRSLFISSKIVCMFALCYQIVLLSIDYFSYPTTVSIDIVNSYAIPMPAFTICSLQNSYYDYNLINNYYNITTNESMQFNEFFQQNPLNRSESFQQSLLIEETIKSINKYYANFPKFAKSISTELLYNLTPSEEMLFNCTIFNSIFAGICVQFVIIDCISLY